VKLHIVPARTGIQWVRLGIRTFFKQPLALAGLFFMYFMVVSLLATVPVIGAAAAFILAPAATLGIMAAAQEAAAGRFPMPVVLISAFRAGPQRTRAMLALGAIYAVVLLAIILLASLFAGPEAAAPAQAPAGAATGAEAGAAANALPQAKVTPSLLIIAALQLPLLVVFAHAPALVHWHGLSPVKSLFFSLVAFWRNLGAFLVFGLAWMGILAVVVLALSILLQLFGTGASVATFMPAALIVASMGTCSVYFTYRDCYQLDEDEPPPLAPPEATNIDNPPGGDAP
jgi:hypothetical protein